VRRSHTSVASSALAVATAEIDREIELVTVRSDPLDERGEARAALDRRRRLRRAKISADVCPVLGLGLDAGPRADPGRRAVDHGGVVMSARAQEILSVGASAGELELAAAWLRSRVEDPA